MRQQAEDQPHGQATAWSCGWADENRRRASIMVTSDERGRTTGMARVKMREQARYYSFGRYLRRRFGCRVHKVTLHAGFTCPNRDGTRGWDGCTFCNNAGFSPNERLGPSEIGQQLADGIARARRRCKAERFIAYFQAYTNTYASPERLKSLYDAVWQFPEVVGLAIGTRPDCVNAEKIALIEQYTRRGEVWIEYGLQSMHDRTLEMVNRQHTYAEFMRAIQLTRGRGIKVCVHTILGLPGETPAMMMETHERLAELDIDGIKVHLLHIMRDTVMERQYQRGEIALLERGEFVGLVCDVLERLPPTVVIQRMHADAPPDILVAPQWCLDKMGVLKDIQAELVRRDTWQGRRLGYGLTDIPSVPLPASATG